MTMTNTTSKTPNDDLLAEVAKYNQHFGNLRIAAEGGQPTYANVLIDRLAARVQELEGEVATGRSLEAHRALFAQIKDLQVENAALRERVRELEETHHDDQP